MLCVKLTFLSDTVDKCTLYIIAQRPHQVNSSNIGTTQTRGTVAVNTKLTSVPLHNRSEMPPFPFSHHSALHSCTNPSFLHSHDV